MKIHSKEEKRFSYIVVKSEIFFPFSPRPRIEATSLENDGSPSKSLAQDSRGNTDEIPGIRRIFFLFFTSNLKKLPASMEFETKAVGCFKLLMNG